MGRLGRPPRGVRKSDYARRDYYDLWLPELAPSQKWVSSALGEPWTDARWRKHLRSYRREMRAPRAQHLLDLSAAISRSTDLSIRSHRAPQAPPPPPPPPTASLHPY